MQSKRAVNIAVGVAFAAIAATVAWATPGSAFVTTALVSIDGRRPHQRQDSPSHVQRRTGPECCWPARRV